MSSWGMSGSPGFRSVREVPVPGPVPLLCNPDWSARLPRLCQGTTWRGAAGSFDMGLFGGEPSGVVQERWVLLGKSVGFGRIVHGRQVHSARVATHGRGPDGRLLVSACDGHATDVAGTLLAVATADCVPVFVSRSDGSAVALLHAGWRGTAEGILKAGVDALIRLTGTEPAGLRVHLGPAICGQCYEVGPEVHAALGQPEPPASLPVDLRRVLGDQATAMGVEPDSITVSELCTRCGDRGLYSHRSGHAGRQVAILGIRSRA